MVIKGGDKSSLLIFLFSSTKVEVKDEIFSLKQVKHFIEGVQMKNLIY